MQMPLRILCQRGFRLEHEILKCAQLARRAGTPLEGHFDTAEDATQEALITAATTRPKRGLSRQPARLG